MVKKIDIIGNTYNYITVLSRDNSKPRYWVCRCDCGKIFSTTKQRLVNGRTKSCGCKKGELLATAFTKHGAAGKGVNSPEYQSYTAMWHRCYTPGRHGWDRYGGRGIIISEERWLESSPLGFLNFLEDMGSRPGDMTLDRRDSDGNYNKENCRWAKKRLQAHNTAVNKTDKNTSQFRGVSLRKATSCWMARIGNGKGGYEYLGDFKQEYDAALAYNFRALELFGEDAKINE